MKRLTQKEFLKKVNDDIEILGLYKNRRSDIKARCRTCRHEWETVAGILVDGHGCPRCAGNVKGNTESFRIYVENNTDFTLLSEYVNNTTYVFLKHNTCGHTFETYPKNFKKTAKVSKCPKCRNAINSKRFLKNHEQFIREVEEQTNGEYNVLSEYKGKDFPVTMIHNKCNHVFEVKPNHFLSSMQSRCPKCKSSKGEKMIGEWLEKHDISFETQYRIKECRNQRPLPFDFAIFNKEKDLIILIEFDGRQHFEPVRGYGQLRKTQINDEIKNNYCENNSIQLLRIRYDVEDLESSLKHMLIMSQAH